METTKAVKMAIKYTDRGQHGGVELDWMLYKDDYLYSTDGVRLFRVRLDEPIDGLSGTIFIKPKRKSLGKEIRLNDFEINQVVRWPSWQQIVDLLSLPKYRYVAKKEGWRKIVGRAWIKKMLARRQELKEMSGWPSSFDGENLMIEIMARTLRYDYPRIFTLSSSNREIELGVLHQDLYIKSEGKRFDIEHEESPEMKIITIWINRRSFFCHIPDYIYIKDNNTMVLEGNDWLLSVAGVKES